MNEQHVVGSSKKRVWEFDRYVDGRLKAEGVRISRAETFEQACLSAVSLASPGSVLVVRPSDETPAALTSIEQLLVEWWGSEMDNAELFNRAVRLSPALADAMQRLPEKANEGQS